MSNPSDLRIFEFTFPTMGKVNVKGLGTKEKEFVVSEIKYEKGVTFTSAVTRSLAEVRPSNIMTEERLITLLQGAAVAGSSLVKFANDSKSTLSSVAE